MSQYIALLWTELKTLLPTVPWLLCTYTATMCWLWCTYICTWLLVNGAWRCLPIHNSVTSLIPSFCLLGLSQYSQHVSATWGHHNIYMMICINCYTVFIIPWHTRCVSLKVKTTMQSTHTSPHHNIKSKTSRKYPHCYHDNKREHMKEEHRRHHFQITLTRIKFSFWNIDLHILHATKYWIQCSKICESSYIPDAGPMRLKHVINIYIQKQGLHDSLTKNLQSVALTRLYYTYQVLN
jgi:hypothetical protein